MLFFIKIVCLNHFFYRKIIISRAKINVSNSIMLHIFIYLYILDIFNRIFITHLIKKGSICPICKKSRHSIFRLRLDKVRHEYHTYRKYQQCNTNLRHYLEKANN